MALFLGIAFPFKQGKTSFPEAASDNDLIKQSLVQLILTGRGERLMRPDVGSGAYSFIFESNDLILQQAIQTEVSTVIRKYEPRVILQGVEVVRGDQSNPDTSPLVTVTIKYIVITTQEAQTLEISFSVGGGAL